VPKVRRSNEEGKARLTFVIFWIWHYLAVFGILPFPVGREIESNDSCCTNDVVARLMFLRTGNIHLIIIFYYLLLSFIIFYYLLLYFMRYVLCCFLLSFVELCFVL